MMSEALIQFNETETHQELDSYPPQLTECARA